jgi:hypothetical protein
MIGVMYLFGDTILDDVGLLNCNNIQMPKFISFRGSIAVVRLGNPIYEAIKSVRWLAKLRIIL